MRVKDTRGDGEGRGSEESKAEAMRGEAKRGEAGPREKRIPSE